MRLFIAASKSLVPPLSDALPSIRQGADVFDVVISCEGRLLELCTPDFYDSRWAKWDAATLPIKVPFEKWQLTPFWTKRPELATPETKKLLAEIEETLKKASAVVIVGNSDSEGPFLIDEIIDHFGFRGQVMRLLLDKKDPGSAETILAASISMQDRSEYQNEYLSELCRSRANWLVGANMSRAVTKLLAHDQKTSIGRIQTPMLALVVRRCMAISAAEPPIQDYHTAQTLVREMRLYARCGTHDVVALKLNGFIEVDSLMGRIKDTAFGRSLVLALPGQLTDPAVLAAWEGALSQVASGDYPPEEFMRRFDIFVGKRLDEIRALSGKVVISQGTPGPQSHQKTMSVPRARTVSKSAVSPRGQHASKPSR